MRSKTITGVASTARVPSRDRLSTLPRDGSASSGASSTSGTATVRRSRAGEVRDRQAGHRVADRLEPVGPPLGADRHRLAVLAEPDEAARSRRSRGPVSVTATRVIASRSCTERTRREIFATSRSRVRARSSAEAERVRSSAIAVSPASASIRRISSVAKARRSPVVAAISTPITRSSTISGTKTALFAPAVSRQPLADERRRFDVVDGDRRGLEERARDPGGLVVQVHAHLAPPREVLAGGARQQADRLVLVLVDERERVEVGARSALRPRRAGRARRRPAPGSARAR